MIEVIQINPTDGQITKLIQTRSRLDVLQLGGLRDKSKWNKPGKAPCFVLQFAKLTQMVDAMFNGLDVPEKHRAGAPTTHPVPESMDFLPFFRRFFPPADLVTDDRIENLSTAARERIQASIPQSLKRVAEWGLENALRQVPDLDGGKCLDVEVRIKSAQASQKV